MEQKFYSLEVVGALLKGENHVREIAKKLGFNHMRVSRSLKELENLNVVDMKKRGRNSIYFLKGSVEAREFSLMFEHYNLVRFVRENKFLKDFIKKIQSDKKIKLALIFGSYAKGLANKNSDVDVFIETQSQDIKDKYSSFDSKISVKVGKLDMYSYLGKEIFKNHVLIKGGEIFYERFFEKT